jgi:hypothetical protein
MRAHCKSRALYSAMPIVYKRLHTTLELRQLTSNPVCPGLPGKEVVRHSLTNFQFQVRGEVGSRLKFRKY